MHVAEDAVQCDACRSMHGMHACCRVVPCSNARPREGLEARQPRAEFDARRGLAGNCRAVHAVRLSAAALPHVHPAFAGVRRGLRAQDRLRAAAEMGKAVPGMCRQALHLPSSTVFRLKSNQPLLEKGDKQRK